MNTITFRAVSLLPFSIMEGNAGAGHNDTTTYINPATGQSVTESYADRAVPNNGGGRMAQHPFRPSWKQIEGRAFNTAASLLNLRGSWQHSTQLALRPRLPSRGSVSLQDFTVTERVNLQFRAEAYNIADTPPLHLPAGDGRTELGSTNFGVVHDFDPNYTPRLYQFAPEGGK